MNRRDSQLLGRRGEESKAYYRFWGGAGNRNTSYLESYLLIIIVGEASPVLPYFLLFKGDRSQGTFMMDGGGEPAFA